MQSTNTDANADIAAPFNYTTFLYFIIWMATRWWSTIHLYTPNSWLFCVTYTCIVKLCIVLNGEDRLNLHAAQNIG